LFPLSIAELPDAGSDHRGFVAKFAIRRLPAPPVVITGTARATKPDTPTKGTKAKAAKKTKKAASTAVATVAP
jgi:hypothetical protein